MKREADIDYRRVRDLTVEEIKASPSFQHLSDEQAKEIIETFKLITKIAYDVHKKVSENKEMSQKTRILKA